LFAVVVQVAAACVDLWPAWPARSTNRPAILFSR